MSYKSLAAARLKSVTAFAEKSSTGCTLRTLKFSMFQGKETVWNRVKILSVDKEIKRE